MDLKQYRASNLEHLRSDDLLRLIPDTGKQALDIGTRDGYFARLLTKRFSLVTALDLEQPSIAHPKINCVKGDVTDLHFDDDSFDFVLCAEVLEHIPSTLLKKACSELYRVSNNTLLIGVPYKQDIRVGRTTCVSCGKTNPPWGHVNVFDEYRLQNLFPHADVVEISFVGQTNAATNFISAFLTDLAHNPNGTYNQDEPCIHCNEKLVAPAPKNVVQKVLLGAAFCSRMITKPFIDSHSNWIHVLFKKHAS